MICAELRTALNLLPHAEVTGPDLAENEVVYRGSLSAACHTISDFISNHPEQLEIGIQSEIYIPGHLEHRREEEQLNDFYECPEITAAAIQALIEKYIVGGGGWVVVKRTEPLAADEAQQ
jgi:hypothetical protein